MTKLNSGHKTILIASPFFYPEPISTGKYNTFLAKKLVEKNNEVKVICSYPFYPSWKPSITRKRLAGVRDIRGGLRIVYPKSVVFRRLILETWFAWHFFKEARKIKDQVDTVVAVSPPLFFTFFVKFLFKKSKKMVIVHDLMGIMATTSNNLSRRLVALIIKQLESLLLRRFDTVICLSDSMRDVLVMQYGLKRATCAVYYPFSTLRNTAYQKDRLKDVFPTEFRHIVYSGAMGEKQKPRELYRFFKDLCNDREDVYCHIFSCGQIVDDLRSDNREKRICFHDLVPDSHLAELYERSDIQIVPQAEGTGAGAFPSKFSNLIVAGVPVLAVCDQESELVKIIMETSAGKAVSGWDFQELRQAVESLLEHAAKDPRARRQTIAERHIQEKFNINKLVESITST